MTENKPILSIVVPVYMEQEVLSEFYCRLKAMLIGLENEFDHEIIMVNDGSTDRTGEILKNLHSNDAKVKVLNFSRNFGHQIAITAGIDISAGDAVIVIDGDLQDPPEIIPKMVTKWREGFQVVYCVRSKRNGESKLKLLTAALFYRIINKISDTNLPPQTGDFRLMDRKVVNALKAMREENRYIRGLVAWIGFSQIGLYYERDSRYAGKTKFNYMKMMRFAIDGITSFSERPLIISSYMGICITFISFIYALGIIIHKFLNPNFAIQGWPSLMVVVVFIGGIQLTSLGIMGTYIGRIYRASKQRPLYIISEKIGIDNNSKHISLL